MDTEEILVLAEKIAEQINMIPRWLKITAAAKYAAMNKDRLKALAESREITGYKDPGSSRGDWIFDKKSLDEYRMRPILEIDKKILSIFNSI